MADTKLTPEQAQIQGRYHVNAVLELRDYFAAMALTGLMAEFVSVREGLVIAEIAEDAYRLADAMLRERAK